VRASNARWVSVAWLLITLWLIACAFVIGGEYSDGYNTIANARHFFGDNPDYFFQRGPLAALVLWPVEVIVGALDLGPFDVRPYHVYSGLLHSAYLFGCWILLDRSGQPFIPRIVAFVAAILSVIFYAYSPYLSHDIIPGVLFLLLIFLCNRWICTPTISTAMQLVLLGTAVTFIKQTYAIFWVSLCVYVVLAFLFKWNEGRVCARKTLLLLALAGLSGTISWIGYGWFTAAEISEVSLLERPLVMLNSVAAQYNNDGDLSLLFPWTLYLQNLHNYGIATVLLVIPGIVLAFRGSDARLKMIAICWLVGVITLQSVTFKEVRYLAFLAPLSAMLIVPVISLLHRSRTLFPALLAVVLIDQYRGMTMAAAQITAAPGVDIARFVGDLENRGKIVTSPNLSFIFMAGGPIHRDRYHGIYHLDAAHLYGFVEGRSPVAIIEDAREFGAAGIRPGDRIFHANLTVAREPPWEDDNRPPMLNDLVMASGNAANIELKLNGDQYDFQGHEGRYLMFIPSAKSGEKMPVIATDKVSVAEIESLYGDEIGNNPQVLGVVVDTLCLADRCFNFD
jgi:hypothetical protein